MENYKNYIMTDGDSELKSLVEKALEECYTIIKRNIPKYASGDVYPIHYKDGKYDVCPNGSPSYWMESFWTGMLWLCYEMTKDEVYRELADKNVLDFYRRVDLNHQLDWHHDIGFLYTLSCVNAYKLTGNELAKEASLMAAYSLARRFRFRGGFIQSMGSDGDHERQNYRFIVDTMMNLPLLFWATEETGNGTYKDKAVRHLNTTLKHIVREDGSTYHHFLMDYETGGPIRGLTLQGAHDESFWSRGQAWMIYGLAIAYDYTGDESLLSEFVRVTDFFIDHLPADCVPYWDMIYNDGDDEPRDSSAGAIAACGIMEMARLIPHDTYKMEKYLDYAKKIIVSLIKNYSATSDMDEEALLLHVTSSKPHGSPDTSRTYADYFYMEMLVRAVKDWERYW